MILWGQHYGPLRSHEPPKQTLDQSSETLVHINWTYLTTDRPLT